MGLFITFEGGEGSGEGPLGNQRALFWSRYCVAAAGRGGPHGRRRRALGLQGALAGVAACSCDTNRRELRGAW